MTTTEPDNTKGVQQNKTLLEKWRLIYIFALCLGAVSPCCFTDHSPPETVSLFFFIWHCVPAGGLSARGHFMHYVPRGSVSIYIFLFLLCARGLFPYIFYLALCVREVCPYIFSPIFFIWHSVPGDCVPILFHLALCARGLCPNIFLFGTLSQGTVSLYCFTGHCLLGRVSLYLSIGTVCQGTVPLYFFIRHCVPWDCVPIFFIWYCVPWDCVPIFFYLALTARGLCPYIFLFGTMYLGTLYVYFLFGIVCQGAVSLYFFFHLALCRYIFFIWHYSARGLCACIVLLKALCARDCVQLFFYLAVCARGLCAYIVLLGSVCNGLCPYIFLFGTLCQGTVFLYFFIWQCEPRD